MGIGPYLSSFMEAEKNMGCHGVISDLMVEDCTSCITVQWDFLP